MDTRYLKSLHTTIIDKHMRDSEETKAAHARISQALDYLQSNGKLTFEEADNLHDLMVAYALEYSLQHFETGFAIGAAFVHESSEAVDSLLHNGLNGK